MTAYCQILVRINEPLFCFFISGDRGGVDAVVAGIVHPDRDLVHVKIAKINAFLRQEELTNCIIRRTKNVNFESRALVVFYTQISIKFCQ